MKKKKKIKIEIQNGNNRNQFSLKNFGYQTCGSFNNHFNTMDNCKNDECVDKNKLYSLKRENSSCTSAAIIHITRKYSRSVCSAILSI